MYPAIGEEVSCWKEGTKEARETAISLGMDSSFFDFKEIKGFVERQQLGFAAL